MLVWRGWGILAVLVPMVTVVVLELAVKAVGGPTAFADRAGTWWAVALLASAGICFRIGQRLNESSVRNVVDEDTGERFQLRRRDDFVFIPLTYWAWPLAGLGVVAAILG